MSQGHSYSLPPGRATGSNHTKNDVQFSVAICGIRRCETGALGKAAAKQRRPAGSATT